MRLGALGAGPLAWRQFLDAVLAESDAQTPFVLARIALLTDPTFQTPGSTSVPGLPGGRPNRALIREAAAALVGYGRQGGDTVADTWLFLGLQQQFRYQRDPRPGEPDELPEMLAALDEAVQIGEALGPDTHAWALVRRARTLRNAHRNIESVAAAERAVAVLTKAGDAPDGPFNPLVAATGGGSWFFGHRASRRYLLLKAHERVANSARMLRDYPRVIAARDREIEVARLLVGERPQLLVGALGQRATLARDLGDVATSLRLLDEQEAFVRANGSHAAQVRRLLSAAAAAQFLDDWDSSIRLRRARIALRLEEFVASPPPMAPGPLLDAVRELEAAGHRAALTNLGNDAYDIVRCLIESGRAELDPTLLAEARQWLDVAESAWRDIALNGQVAVDFRRLQLDALQGVAGESTTVGHRMVAYSRAWRRANGQRRSAVVAVRHGAPGDRTIFDRLTELMAAAPAVDLAHLRVGTARWHLRSGDALAAQDRAEAAQAAWAQAARDAEIAVGGLSVERDDGPPVLLDPDAVVEAYRIWAHAARARRDAGLRSAETSPDRELAVRVASLTAVAQRFIACGTPTQRQVLEKRYGSWLVETLLLAVEVADLTAADRTAEVMRRDLVGSVLFAIADDELAPEQIATLARQLTATLAARPVEDGADTGEPGTTAGDASGDDNGPDAVTPQTRARGIAAQIDEALDVVGTVLGPVARSLFDPRTVLRHTTTSATERLYPHDRGVLLSLVLVTDPHGSHVVRRMVWRAKAGSGLQEHLDVVPAPRWLAGLAIDDDSNAFFARVGRLTNTLLPAPLVELLAEADAARPVPLTIVPTGLLAVPFSALAVNGRLLLDVAVVSVVQSLQVIETLTRPGVEPSLEALDVGVYDTALKHAGYEWDELRRYRPRVRPASSLQELTDLFGNPGSKGGPGLLALAIHGTRGADGWTQAKQLPSGETLTSGHVLQWYLPALVVGASCNTDIRADAGGELGGFPLAFQLRGTVNIIGSLHAIEDEATAQIMALFYAATVEGLSAAAALRQAQRGWIADDRAQRLPVMARWAYLLCYGLPV